MATAELVVTDAASAAAVARPRLAAVAPLPTHGRRGVLWALLTAGAVAGGAWSLAAWLALCATVAVAATVRTWRHAEGRGGARPAPAGGLLAAAGAPLAAAGGRAAFAAAVCAALVLAVVPHRAEIASALRAGLEGRGAGSRERAAVVGVELIAAGLCAGALVLIDRASVTAVAALLTLVCCHDASRYLVGTGAPAPWEGAVAGVAAVGSATLALIVLQPSPLTGAYVWVLGLVVAVAGMVGRPASRLLAPEGHAVPGVWRRMDTLLMAAPVWLLVVTWAHL